MPLYSWGPPPVSRALVVVSAPCFLILSDGFVVAGWFCSYATFVYALMQRRRRVSFPLDRSHLFVFLCFSVLS